MAAYLMTVTNLDYAGALAFIASKRAGANPNVGFRMQLMKFAQQVTPAFVLKLMIHLRFSATSTRARETCGRMRGSVVRGSLQGRLPPKQQRILTSPLR